MTNHYPNEQDIPKKRVMSKDKASDAYCDTSVSSSIKSMKHMGVSDVDIILALNRAILKLQYEEWQKREGKNNV